MGLNKLIILTFLIGTSVCQGFTVLVDPGHGGSDIGAKSWIKKGNKKVLVQEKDLALDISREIKKELNKLGIDTYLTRDSDKTVTLEKRAEVAELIKADLFISVHINASHKHRGHGFETYFLDNHEDVAVRMIEQVENKDADGSELVVNKILADIIAQTSAPASRALANNIHGKLVRNLKPHKMRDRGVKPALFYVLALSKRPAVLLEAGFLTSSKDVKKLVGQSFQKSYAKGVAAGIYDYLRSVSPKISSL